MTELGPTAKSVLADYAAVVGPQYGETVQNWHELVKRIDRGEPEMQLAPIAKPARGRVRAIVALSCAAAAAIAALWLGGRASVAALEADDRPNAASWQGGSLVEEPEPAAVVDQVVVVDDDERRRARPRTPEAPVAVAPFVPPPPPAPIVAQKSKPRAPTPRVERTDDAPTDAASTLEQVGAIRKAYAALKAGDPSQALRVLDAHAKRWPTSEFAGERDLLRVKALCAAGRTSEAESAAAAFKRKHPGSPLGAALKQCAGDGSTP